MNNEPILLLADILQEEMELDNDRIWIYNEEIDIPRDENLFIVLQYLSSTPYAVNNKVVEGGRLAREIQSYQAKEDILINIASKGIEAFNRKEDVLLALRSIYSQTVQETNQFRIDNISNSFLDISSVEGAGILNRYAINITLYSHRQREKTISFYDSLGNNSLNKEN